MSLADWAKNRWIKEHKTSPGEIQDLLLLADRDIEKSQIKELGEDLGFSIAYNAILQCANAALAVAGYRAGDHAKAIESLRFTIGSETDLIRLFDSYRQKRHDLMYERTGLASAKDLVNIIKKAKEIRREAERWIRATRPELLE
jgi:uncharacterized protein (UPF0332 family)